MSENAESSAEASPDAAATDAPRNKPRPNTAEGQNSVIPLGWKPTRSQPVPVVRCVQIKRNGERCKRWSLRGYDKCLRHAGPGARMADGNVRQYAEAVIEAGRLRLIDDSDEAIDTLHDLIQPGSGEGIRLKAATEILDRAGIRGGYEVKSEQEIIVSGAEAIRDRLSKLASGAAAVDDMRNRRTAADDDPDDIVDAELVEDEQLSLFDLPSPADPDPDPDPQPDTDGEQ
jgi:hypothetical protein